MTKHLVRILTTTSDIGTLEFTSYALQVRAVLWQIDLPTSFFECVGLAKNVYICTVYDRTSDIIPAQSTVYTPYVCGSPQPYECAQTVWQ